jgi:hypothetical protein
VRRAVVGGTSIVHFEPETVPPNDNHQQMQISMAGGLIFSISLCFGHLLDLINVIVISLGNKWAWRAADDDDITRKSQRHSNLHTNKNFYLSLTLFLRMLELAIYYRLIFCRLRLVCLRKVIVTCDSQVKQKYSNFNIYEVSHP